MASRLRRLASSNLWISATVIALFAPLTVSIGRPIYLAVKSVKSLPSKKIKDKRDDDANKDASGEREIERKALAFDRNIAGQMAQPGQLAGQGKDHSDRDQQNPEVN
jgi:hypothetical protein